MKKYFYYLFAVICFFYSSCKSLPVVEPAGTGFKPDINPFPREKFQLTHSIKADLPNGDILLVIGLTVVDPVLRSIHAVMMTVEGLVLFDAGYKNNTVTIIRGMPGISPEDSTNFVNGLMDDLKLIYFIPECAVSEPGKINGKFVERYKCGDGITVDLINEGNGAIIINKYDSGNSLLRTINIFSLNKENLPEKLELISPGIFGYSLYMELVNVEKI